MADSNLHPSVASIGSNFPGIADTLKRAHRTPVNPLDVSTVVSIFPKHLPTEKKPTLQPGVFQIPYGTYENPGILHVGGSSWWREIDEHQPLLEIPVSSLVIAESIVNDFCNGILACDMADRKPGLFYLPGRIEVRDIPKKMLDEAAAKQKNWYLELVSQADILWARTSGNPLSISDDMRLAAQELKLKDKAWLKDYNTVQMVNCPACGALRNSNYPICSVCRTIVDKAAFEKSGFKQLV